MAAVAQDAVRPSPRCVDVFEAMSLVRRWWQHAHGEVYLGIARRSLLSRIREEGVTGAGQAGAVRAGTYLPPDVVELDQLIAGMPARLRQVIVLDQDRRESFKTMAAKLHTSPGECSKMRERAYGWLAGALTMIAREGQPD